MNPGRASKALIGSRLHWETQLNCSKRHEPTCPWQWPQSPRPSRMCQTSISISSPWEPREFIPLGCGSWSRNITTQAGQTIQVFFFFSNKNLIENLQFSFWGSSSWWLSETRCKCRFPDFLRCLLGCGKEQQDLRHAQVFLLNR